MPMPIIGEPFNQIAMDIVGPLPKSKRGNRYLLVVVDYATRYPEVFPLRTFTADVVAEKLVEVFARHGVPRTILTDQGSKFTSNLLQELHRAMGVKSVRTSPYHPQTDGLVERYNRTFKELLRRTIESHKREWDVLIPYVLFAYREVPQESTGFSPFELVYGRDVRGPLDVLREEWIQDQQSPDDMSLQ